MHFRRALQQIIDAEVWQQQQKLKSVLGETSTLSVTMDIWSDAKMRDYPGLTVHYLSQDCLTSSILGVPQLQGNYLSLNLILQNVKTDGCATHDFGSFMFYMFYISVAIWV